MRRGNENKTKQIKIANVRRNLVPIVVQVQGDKQVARALESWLAPCLEEDRIDRKCLGRERSTMNESRCRWNAVHWQTCVRETDKGREGLGGRGGGSEGLEGKERAVTMRVAFLAWPSHLHLVSLTSCSTTPRRSYPISTSCVSLTGLSTRRRPFC